MQIKKSTARIEKEWSEYCNLQCRLVRMFLIIWASTAVKNLGEFIFTLQKKKNGHTHAGINDEFRD
jgi:hypothetical protein